MKERVLKSIGSKDFSVFLFLAVLTIFFIIFYENTFATTVGNTIVILENFVAFTKTIFFYVAFFGMVATAGMYLTGRGSWQVGLGIVIVSSIIANGEALLEKTGLSGTGVMM